MGSFAIYLTYVRCLHKVDGRNVQVFFKIKGLIVQYNGHTCFPEGDHMTDARIAGPVVLAHEVGCAIEVGSVSPSCASTRN